MAMACFRKVLTTDIFRREEAPSARKALKLVRCTVAEFRTCFPRQDRRCTWDIVGIGLRQTRRRVHSNDANIAAYDDP